MQNEVMKRPWRMEDAIGQPYAALKERKKEDDWVSFYMTNFGS